MAIVDLKFVGISDHAELKQSVVSVYIVKCSCNERKTMNDIVEFQVCWRRPSTGTFYRC